MAHTKEPKNPPKPEPVEKQQPPFPQNRFRSHLQSKRVSWRPHSYFLLKKKKAKKNLIKRGFGDFQGGFFHIGEFSVHIEG